MYIFALWRLRRNQHYGVLFGWGSQCASRAAGDRGALKRCSAGSLRIVVLWVTSGLVLYHFGARAGLLLRDGLAKASPFLGSLVYWHFEVMFTALPSVLFLRGLFYWCFGRCGSLNYRPLAARLEDSAAPGTSSY